MAAGSLSDHNMRAMFLHVSVRGVRVEIFHLRREIYDLRFAS
jgi:hypothetical protein